MRVNTALLVAGAAAVVSAQPHGHGHGHFHERRADAVEIVYETVTETKFVDYDPTPSAAVFAEVPTTSSKATTTTTSTPPPAPTTPTTTSTPKAVPTTPTTTTSPTSKAAASPSTAASSGSSSGSTNSGSAHTYTDFKCSASKRATAADISYKGNVGTPYGCNMMMVDSVIADKYTYSIDFVNVASTPYAVTCWNKYGNDGLLDGWYQGKGQPVTFTVPVGSSQAVAFQPNSQGACAVSPNSVAVVTKSGTNPNGGFYETGAIAGSWAEFDFGSGTNGGWSGFDTSVLLAQRNTMDVYGLQLCSADCSNTCSSIANGASTGTNAYTIGMEAVDGTGGNCPESKIKITAKMGWSG